MIVINKELKEGYMRLALFTDTFVPQMNGVANTLQRLTVYLQRRGIEYLIFAPKCAPKDIYADPIRPIASIPLFLYPECRLALPNLLAIRAELDRFRPNLIHLATPFNLGLCGLRYAQSHHTPYVTSYHTHFDRYLEYYRVKGMVPLYWSYIKWFHRSCDATFAPSIDTINTLQSHGIDRLKLWSRGVDCQLFTPEKRHSNVRERYGINEPILLLYVGRIAPEKDIHTLSAIMRTLPESAKKRVHWLVVGDGPLLPELRGQVPSNVTFTGYKQGDELAQLYASADIFVFPSSTETFGNVVLEAMASGLPVIAANAGGVKEIVVPNHTGVLCEPGHPESFVREICNYIDSPQRLASLGIEARQVALTRSWEAIFDELLGNYLQIIDSHRIGSPSNMNTA